MTTDVESRTWVMMSRMERRQLFDALFAGDQDNYVRVITTMSKSDCPYAQDILGRLYSDGEIVPKDLEKAAYWFRKSAERGSPLGQLRIGRLLLERTLPDFTEAHFWIRMSANQGYGLAQDALGEMYLCGTGRAQNVERAAHWFRLAAEQGIPRAQYELAVAYRDGRGVSQDLKQGVKWMKMAARRNWPQAQFELGTMYLQGVGVRRSLDRGGRWRQMAAQHGYTQASDRSQPLQTRGLKIKMPQFNRHFRGERQAIGLPPPANATAIEGPA